MQQTRRRPLREGGGSHVGAGILGGPSVWRRIRETGLTVDKARDLVGQVKALTPTIHHDKFDWEMTNKDQGNFDLKMMVFLWFKSEFTSRDRKMA